VESTKKPKAEAGKKQANKKEDPAGGKSAGKKASKNAASTVAIKKAASKKAAGKNVARKKVASKKAASNKAKASRAAKQGAAKGEGGEVARGTAKQRTISAPARIEQNAAQAAELDPFEVAKQTMKGSVPAIVEAMVQLAKQGSCSHAKTLLEMTGAKHMFCDEAERQDSGEPWAKLVLERMDEAEQESLQETPLEVVTQP
jgi:hypothetical protein